MFCHLQVDSTVCVVAIVVPPLLISDVNVTAFTVVLLSFFCHLSFSNKIEFMQQVEFYFSKLVHALWFKLHPHIGNVPGTGRPFKSFTVCLSCQTKQKQIKHINKVNLNNAPLFIDGLSCAAFRL